MEKQDHQPIEALASQRSDCIEEREVKNGTTLPYRPPQVFYVGRAKRLMAGSGGTNTDASAQFML